MPLPKGLSLRSVYCARANCLREHFARSVFWASLPPNKKVVVMALQWAWPRWFKLDFELVEGVGKATSMQDFENEVVLHYGGIRERSWLRDRLKLRMSLHRLRKVAMTYLPKD